MRPPSKIGARLIVVAVLECFLTYRMFEWEFRARPRGVFFPLEMTLILAALSAMCIVALIPVVARGDLVERCFAAILIILPIKAFISAITLTLKFMSNIYG